MSVVSIPAWRCRCFFALRCCPERPDGEFTVQSSTRPGPRNSPRGVEARTDGKTAFSLGLFANYANDPFTVKSRRTQTDCEAVTFQQQDVKVIETFSPAYSSPVDPIPGCSSACAFREPSAVRASTRTSRHQRRRPSRRIVRCRTRRPYARGTAPSVRSTIRTSSAVRDQLLGRATAKDNHRRRRSDRGYPGNLRRHAGPLLHRPGRVYREIEFVHHARTSSVMSRSAQNSPILRVSRKVSAPGSAANGTNPWAKPPRPFTPLNSTSRSRPAAAPA